MKKFLLDNHPEKLVNYLNEHLRECEEFRLVSAYFSIYGYAALRDELNTLENVRFLLGEPELADVASGQGKPFRLATLEQDGLSFAYSDFWQQPLLAKQCATWLKNESVLVRSMVQSNFLHGKMYHMQKSAENSAATVGSSNFTSRGLGKSTKSNLEINISIEDQESRDELAKWFDKLWNDDKQTKDVKNDVLAVLGRLYEPYSPEFIYYQTLYELFRDEIKNRKKTLDELADGGDYKSTRIWDTLYEFQRDAVGGILSRLQQHNGCILADSVGLGKTYTALAVIKHFEMRNKNVLVLCPKKLRGNWETYQAATHRASNPLIEDKFAYALLSHTDLGRESGKSDAIELSDFHWDKYDLVVIDESHNFRNDTKTHRKVDKERNEFVPVRSRYQRLIEDVIQSGAQTKVLMLSATPVNTSLLDLRNQINIMTAGRDDAFHNSLNINSTKSLFTTAERRFKTWEKENKNKKEKKRAQLLELLGGDFMRLLDGVTIARSRRQIQDFYPEFIEKEGQFPTREIKNFYPHTDIDGRLEYEKFNDKLKSVKFFIYCPSRYIKDKTVRERLDAEKEKYHYNQENREEFLVGMMRANFMKRLESSAYALELTLGRTIDKIRDQIKSINDYLELQEDAKVQPVGKDEEDLQDEDEDFVVNSKVLQPFYLKDLDVEKWRKELLQDKEILEALVKEIEPISPVRDNKLHQLKKLLREKSGKDNKKILVFTAFKDTAEYLYKNILDDAKECGIEVAMVAGGDVTYTKKGKNKFWDILNNFSPKARTQKYDDEIDLLIATDCVSEGQNLQDCDTVLNYDIHWNPVRLIQRFGRIDRIGSKNDTVQMLNFWPTENMDYYLGLEARVTARMALVDATTTLENSIEIEEAAQGEITLRDVQLREMFGGKVIDSEEFNAVSMSDLTLEHFLMQLLNYLKKDPNKFEDTPLGVHAVVNAADAKLSQPGAVFVFRHKNPPENSGGNLLLPHYIVHVDKKGVHASYTQAQNTLNVLNLLSNGKDKPLLKLCDVFDNEIETPEGKAFYSKIAKWAVENIQATDNKESVKSILMGAQRGAKVPKKSERPDNENLQLLTWFAIKEE